MDIGTSTVKCSRNNNNNNNNNKNKINLEVNSDCSFTGKGGGSDRNKEIKTDLLQLVSARTAPLELQESASSRKETYWMLR